MGTSSRIRRSLPAFLLPAALLLLAMGSTRAAEDAAAALTIANHLQLLPLTLLHMPGCCSPCGWIDPPPGLQCSILGCVRCPNVVIDAGKAMTLPKKVGPYPLSSLKIQVEEVVYCVAAEDLKFLTASVTLTVGPEKCGPVLQAIASKNVTEVPRATLCLPLCSV